MRRKRTQEKRNLRSSAFSSTPTMIWVKMDETNKNDDNVHQKKILFNKL